MNAPADRLLRLAGAALLLAGGAIHVLLAFDGYGTEVLQDVFLLNGAASAVVALLVLVVPGPLPALAGAGVAGASLLALGMSRVGDGVLGFRGTGLDPMPEVPLTILVEVATLGLLAVAAARARKPLVDTARDALPGS